MCPIEHQIQHACVLVISLSSRVGVHHKCEFGICPIFWGCPYEGISYSIVCASITTGAPCQVVKIKRQFCFFSGRQPRQLRGQTLDVKEVLLHARSICIISSCSDMNSRLTVVAQGESKTLYVVMPRRHLQKKFWLGWPSASIRALGGKCLTYPRVCLRAMAASCNFM